MGKLSDIGKGFIIGGACVGVGSYLLKKYIEHQQKLGIEENNFFEDSDFDFDKDWFDDEEEDREDEGGYCQSINIEGEEDIWGEGVEMKLRKGEKTSFNPFVDEKSGEVYENSEGDLEGKLDAFETALEGSKAYQEAQGIDGTIKVGDDDVSSDYVKAVNNALDFLDEVEKGKQGNEKKAGTPTIKGSNLVDTLINSIKEVDGVDEESKESSIDDLDPPFDEGKSEEGEKPNAWEEEPSIWEEDKEARLGK